MSSVLAHAHNLQWLIGLQTAKEWKVRPLEYFGVEREGPWTQTDRVLAEALEIHGRNTCPDCGHHARVAYDEDLNGWFEVETSVCEACAVRERWLKEEEKRSSEPGTKVRVGLDPSRA